MRDIKTGKFISGDAATTPHDLARSLLGLTDDQVHARHDSARKNDERIASALAEVDAGRQPRKYRDLLARQNAASDRLAVIAAELRARQDRKARLHDDIEAIVSYLEDLLAASELDAAEIESFIVTLEDLVSEVSGRRFHDLKIEHSEYFGDIRAWQRSIGARVSAVFAKAAAILNRSEESRA